MFEFSFCSIYKLGIVICIHKDFVDCMETKIKTRQKCEDI